MAPSIIYRTPIKEEVKSSSELVASNTLNNRSSVPFKYYEDHSHTAKRLSENNSFHRKLHSLSVSSKISPYKKEDPLSPNSQGCTTASRKHFGSGANLLSPGKTSG